MSDLPPPQPGAPQPLPPPGAAPPPPTSTPPIGGSGPPFWRRWWFIVACAVVALLVVGGIVGAVATGGDDDDGTASERTAAATVATSSPTETSVPETAAPASTAVETIPTATEVPTTKPTSDQLVVGDIATLDDGSQVRVGSITPNAPPANEFTQPDPGTSFTRVGVEACAGSDGLEVNALYFKGFLDDNTSADVALGAQDLATVGLRPGGCTAGSIDLTVPDGRTVASVVLTGTLFEEQARWSTASSSPVTGPLVASSAPDAAALGESVTLDGGATAVVRSVTPNAPPRNEFSTPGDERQFVEAAVQLCAGSEPYSVNPLYWLATMQDNYTAGVSLGAQTLDTLDVAAGQCVAGTVAFSVPAGATPASVVLTNELFDEVGRWRAA